MVTVDEAKVMRFKLWTFWFSLLRWVALVALVLLPTALVIVAYRWMRGRELWSMADLPVAAEVTLCIAWLSLLFATHELICAHFGLSPDSSPVIWGAAIFCAVPVGLAYKEIERLKRVFGKDRAGDGRKLASTN